jgi:Tfp pilus assembly protein PilF
LADAYARTGQKEKAVESLGKALESSGSVTMVRLHAACTYARLGKTAKAREVLEQAKTAWEPDGRSSYWIAAVHTSLGEKDAAFEWLEKAFLERPPFLVWIKVHPLFEGLRDDPRFAALLKRIGIPD